MFLMASPYAANVFLIMMGCNFIALLYALFQPLKDPDLDGGALEREQAVRKLEMDEKISALHGAKLFKEFVGSINREGNMPSFLKNVMLHTPPPGQTRKKQNHH